MAIGKVNYEAGAGTNGRGEQQGRLSFSFACSADLFFEPETEYYEVCQSLGPLTDL